VDDLIEGIMRLFERGTADPTNIGNPHEFTVRQLAERVLALTGSKSKIVQRPLPVDDPQCGSPTSPPPARRLGWEPAISLEDGLRTHDRVLQEHAEVTHHYLVTGAAGFIGSHLSEALIARGAAVTGVDNFDAFYPREVKRAQPRGPAQASRLPVRRGRRRARSGAAGRHRGGHSPRGEARRAPVARGSRLLHGSERHGDGAPDRCGTARGLSRIVFGSSSSVYGNATPAPFAEDKPAVSPISPYAASKRAGELLAHASHTLSAPDHLPAVLHGVRPRQRPDLAIHKFTDLIARGRPVRMHGDGSSERDYTYITDCLTAFSPRWSGAPRLPRDGRDGQLGGGERVRLDRLIALIAAALGQEARIERHPDQPGDVRLTDADLAHAGRVLASASRRHRRGHPQVR